MLTSESGEADISKRIEECSTQQRNIQCAAIDPNPFKRQLPRRTVLIREIRVSGEPKRLKITCVFSKRQKAVKNEDHSIFRSLLDWTPRRSTSSRNKQTAKIIQNSKTRTEIGQFLNGLCVMYTMSDQMRSLSPKGSISKARI